MIENIQKAVDSVCGMTMQFKEDEDGELILDLSALLQRVAVTATELEREECAKLCDALERKKWETISNGGKLYGWGAKDCAAAIRGKK